MSTTDDTNAACRGSGSNDLLGQATERDEMPPWLLPLHEATLIANMHRVRVGAVQAIAKATHTALQAALAKLQEPTEDAESFRLRFPGAVAAIEAAERERWQQWLRLRADAVEAASPLAAKALRNAADEFEA